jgi:ATP-dependent RNA helicase DDX1
MGLAISFVSTVPEKVWYHTCPSKGKNCHNTKLLDQHGCCKWYTELTYLADIEEHLGRRARERNSLFFYFFL